MHERGTQPGHVGRKLRGGYLCVFGGRTGRKDCASICLRPCYRLRRSRRTSYAENRTGVVSLKEPVSFQEEECESFPSQR